MRFTRRYTRYLPHSLVALAFLKGLSALAADAEAEPVDVGHRRSATYGRLGHPPDKNEVEVSSKARAV